LEPPLSTEKDPIVRQVTKIAKCAQLPIIQYTGHKRHCRGSGFVLVRTAVTRPWKMLLDARMAGLVKLRRGIGVVGGSQFWAGVSVDAGLG